MKILPFVVYELFNENCQRCSLETSPIPVLSFQFLSKGKESLDQESDDQKTQKVRLSVNCIKRYFWIKFCSKVVLQFLEGKLFSPVFIGINKRNTFWV